MPHCSTRITHNNTHADFERLNMPLNLTTDCTFTGPALPEPFVKFNLEAELNRLALLPKATGAEGRALDEHWKFVRRKLAALVSHGGGVRVQNHVIEPLLTQLGYARIEPVEAIQTREGAEDGGALLITEHGAAKLRVWCVDLNADLDAPARRGLAYRFSHTRIAQRVLLATGERLGIVTNGLELRLLISDPARVDSQVAISIDPHWKRSRDLPDSVRLLIALASPAGVKALPELIDKARLQQAKVTKDLREQARSAIREFIQELVDHPENQPMLAGYVDKNALAKDLWHEGLITVYRLLFILKLESTDDPARSFSFASTSLWRNTFSPSVALAPIVRRVLDHGAQTGRLLQDGLRALFRMLSDGLQCTELNVRPMAGALFAPATTPILGRLYWSEIAIAKLLDNLLWTRTGRGATARERVHYGPLDVEDLGRVYEALLELEPGITAETMCRLRRAKLEVVVPAAQGEHYKPVAAAPVSEPTTLELAEDESDEEPEVEEESGRGKKTKVEWIEEVPPGRFYLRVGLGRKATGSFYTPHSFVRFLVRETLDPLVQRVSPADDPQPCAILKLKVIDKAMGSGHFLVEACRFLGEALYDAARRCDELAASAEKNAEAYRASAKTKPEHEALAAEMLARAATHHQRVIDLPDPDDELLRYLPSRSVEGTAGGVSHNKAIALCRRMVAVHCLYGVDKNPLAVELAKLALWIECHAEGLPLTFLDHRLVVGDSLTGPFFEHLLKYPGSQQPLDDLFTQGLTAKLTAALADALQHVRALEATVGVTVADIEAKQAAKTRLDRALAPFKILAAAWSGGVMLGPEGCDDTAYAALAKHIAENGNLPEDWLTAFGNHVAMALLKMVSKGLGLPAISENVSDYQTLTADLNKNAIPALPFDIAFPEVFHPDAAPTKRSGFDANIGNPPWEVTEVNLVELLSVIDPEVARGSSGELEAAIAKMLNHGDASRLIEVARTEKDERQRIVSTLVTRGNTVSELAACFIERGRQLCSGFTGLVVPSGYHKNKELAWLREPIWQQREMRSLIGFVNKRKLFADLPVVLQFNLLVLEHAASPSQSFRSAFRQTDDAVLVTDDFVVNYPWLFAANANTTFTLVELPSREDALVCAEIYARDLRRTKAIMASSCIDFSQELNQNSFGRYFQNIQKVLENPSADVRAQTDLIKLLDKRHIPMLESKSFGCFDILWAKSEGSHWNPVPSLALMVDSDTRIVKSKLAGLAGRLRHFRLFGRETCGSTFTNERSAVFVMALPGLSAVHSAVAETEPQKRPSHAALSFLAAVNSFSFDYLIRLQVGAHLSKFILEAIPFPPTPNSVSIFLAHQALRLSAQHAGYAPLWREQLGEAWREAGAAFTWPVLSGDAARWAVRAAIDAVVAHAYGLTRDQYAHVLSTFSHSSYKDAPRQCLAAFDELQKIGLEAFTKKHDPYWNIPLNENLPQPVIDLPIREPVTDPGPAKSHKELFDFQTTAAPAGSGKLFTEEAVPQKRKKGTSS